MNQKSRAFRPGGNDLEARAMLSLAAPGLPVGADVLSVSSVRHPSVTSGTVRGRYLSTGEDLRAADAPLQVNLNGTGNVQGLGRVTMTGGLSFGGFRPPGQPDLTGTVTLANARGSVTIQLTGSGGFARVPNSRFGLQASIVGGTGEYANLRGIGTANALFGVNTVRCIKAPCPVGGTLTLQLHLRPPIR